VPAGGVVKDATITSPFNFFNN